MGQLENLYLQNRYNRDISAKSAQWFRREATYINQHGISSDTALREGGIQSTKLSPGGMYMFYYSPKYKDELDYYDTFPLLLPYDTTPNGFIGLNLHYLPPIYRIKLLDALLDISGNKSLTPNTKLKYTWSTIKASASSKWAAPCIHRYIGGYVKSRFVEVSPENWFTAALLPVQRFKKMSDSKVWGNSLG